MRKEDVAGPCITFFAEEPLQQPADPQRAGLFASVNKIDSPAPIQQCTVSLLSRTKLQGAGRVAALSKIMSRGRLCGAAVGDADRGLPRLSSGPKEISGCSCRASRRHNATPDLAPSRGLKRPQLPMYVL